MTQKVGSRTVVCIFTLYCCFHGTKFEKVAPTGHLQPLGSHRPPEGGIQSLDFVPDPYDFFHSYVLRGKPVIFKGAAKSSKGFYLWTDEYLRYALNSLKPFFL